MKEITDLKQCRGCKDWKSIYCFHKHKSGSNGLNPRCKDCVCENTIKYSEKTEHRYVTARRMAIRRGKQFKISIPEFEYINSLQCFYCDGYFGKVRVSGGLDRIDNKKGYELMNVLPCCTVCNRTRQDNFSVEETRLVIQTIIASREKHEVRI